MHFFEARIAYQQLVAQGWTDAIRKLQPNERIYTFWKYWRNAFQRDAGLRIDHFLLNARPHDDLKQPVFIAKFAAGLDRAVRFQATSVGQPPQKRGHAVGSVPTPNVASHNVLCN